ncbi:hypothetical protein HY837_00155 [archaeon]|nr:hypothetical protein [archaeon]
MLDWFMERRETPVKNRAEVKGIVLTEYGLLDDSNGKGFHLPSQQDIDEIFFNACQSGRLTVQCVQAETQKQYSGRLTRIKGDQNDG